MTQHFYNVLGGLVQCLIETLMGLWLQCCSMAQNNAATDATLTEYLPAADNARDTIDGVAKVTLVQDGRGIWVDDDGESLDEVNEYRVECSCGETFGNWGAATRHAESEH